LKQLDIYGAITGKAMYAETLSLSQAIALCGEA
jgi:phosphoribosylformimino-5-aminoimidazole carboxamide ribotide isomerase